MTCPGLGMEVGASLGVNRSFYQGFFLAPMVTKGALKGAVFAANIYEKLGFPVIPDGQEPRQDIIQAVTLGEAERVVAFCKGIQAAAPVDSYVDPEPWDMPGYDSQVIMAAGAFVQGSSIELSLSAHREENIDTEKNFNSLFNAINKMAEKYDMPILYSCHPRSRKRLEQSGFQLDKRVIQHEPLGFHDYNCLQMNAFCVVSDSGTLPEESSFFTSVGHPFPAVCIRTSTERPEALDKGDFILAGIDGNHLLQAVDVAVEMNKNRDLGIPVPDYVDENVSDKVVKIIQSYTGVIDKMVWRKY